MSNSPSSRWFTLLQRELQEYRVSLVWTPVIMALVLVVGMLLSVVLANRISAVGKGFFEVVTQEPLSGIITIHIDDDSDKGDSGVSYRIEEEVSPMDEGDWNFSREWTFKPRLAPDAPPGGEVVTEEEIHSFNPILGVVNSLMMLVLLTVTVNYLLGSLYDDRRDRSILFWKSMPVTEWEVVLSKFIVALVVAPAVFIGVSLLLQVACTLLAMLLLWRMDMDPFAQVLGNIDLGRLLVEQIGGWLTAALWVAPLYAWLLTASAAARRSPFLVAVVPVLGLVLLEEVLLGSEYLGIAIGSHLPVWVGSSGEKGVYLLGPHWSHLDMLSLVGGLACAAALIAAAVWLRRHRWEI